MGETNFMIGEHKMIFAISDIHGHFGLMETRVNQIKPYLNNGDNKLILLGDYIDRGKDSFRCLKAAYDLQKELGEEKVIVLKGNHEVWFGDFLYENDDIWLSEDKNFRTSGTFLTEEQLEELKRIVDRDARISYIKENIVSNHKELMSWMMKLKKQKKVLYEKECF